MGRWKNKIEIDEMIGKTFQKVYMNGANDEIYFVLNDKERYVMYHCQDCCEDVFVEDICGELEWLENTQIIKATEDTNTTDDKKNEYDDSFTWTFYNFATQKGYVTIRWYGSSNGYYSESVDICKEIFE